MSDLYSSIEVLVVDDLATMRKIIKKILGQLEIKNIDEADDGTTAIPQLEGNTYDLVLVDWDLPKMNGLNLIKHIRSNEATES